jgi:hypothetical protein
MSRLLDHSTIFQLTDQFAPRSVDPSLDRAQGTIQRGADLCVTQFMLMEQQKSLTILGPQRAERPLDFFGQISGFRDLQGIVAQVVDQGSHRWLPHAHRQQRSAAIAGDGQQPGKELALLIPRAQAAEHSNQRFLCHVLGILSMPQHAITKAEYLAAVRVDQFDHGRLVAAQASTHQLKNVVGGQTVPQRSSKSAKREYRRIIPLVSRGPALGFERQSF